MGGGEELVGELVFSEMILDRLCLYSGLGPVLWGGGGGGGGGVCVCGGGGWMSENTSKCTLVCWIYYTCIPSTVYFHSTMIFGVCVCVCVATLRHGTIVYSVLKGIIINIFPIQEVSTGVGGAKRHFDITSVDPSEYEPQVVELSEQLIQDSPLSEEEPLARERSQKDDHPERRERESSNTPTDGARKDDAPATTTANKNARWLSKLQKLRQQFTTPPTD